MTSTQKSILDAVKTTIDGLSLTGVEEAKVRTHPEDAGQFYPGITIHPIKEDELLGTNEQDDIGYGIQITMVINDDDDLDEDDIIGTWRQNIRKAFIHQRVSGITGCCTTYVEHGPVYTPNDENLTISTLILRVIVREARS